MIGRPRPHALGIDIGSERIRVASVESGGGGTVRVRAVAARPVPQAIADGPARTELLAALIDEMRDELDTKTRRCVLAVGPSDASVHRAEYPVGMRGAERLRAARLELRHRLGEGEREPIVRIKPLDAAAGWYAVARVSRMILHERRAIARAAGLHLAAVDLESFAFRRVFPQADAVLDIGLHTSRLHLFAPDLPQTRSFEIGGEALTSAIAEDLDVTQHVAEERKRSIGLAGAGERAVRRLAELVRSAVAEGGAQTRAAEHGVARRLVVTGNGARLAGLAARICEAAGYVQGHDVPAPLLLSGYPEGIQVHAAPDWALAVGLALWRRDA
jgi:Tfp pilus assembly PilM family ATPase